jgi:hypothetical protein
MQQEQDQVNSAVEETKQEETVELTEAEQQEQVKSLLGEKPQETVQEGTETETQEETQEEVKETQSVEPMISDEMIEQFPQLKMYRGKPIKDLGKAYANLVGKLHQIIKENNELKGKLEKSSLTELGDPPDPIENREAFDKWLTKRDELIKSQIKVQPQPTIDPLAEVRARLPKDVDVNKIADEWAKFNSRMLFDETGELKKEMKAMYEREPELMIDSIVNFYGLLSKAEQNELTIETKAKGEAYKQTKDAFKKARQTQKESSQVNVIPRTNETTSEDELLNKIYQLAQG